MGLTELRRLQQTDKSIRFLGVLQWAAQNSCDWDQQTFWYALLDCAPLSLQAWSATQASIPAFVDR